MLFYSDRENGYFLSNFYPHNRPQTMVLTFEGVNYPTSEHLYQALKFKADDESGRSWRLLISQANTPFISKYLAHQVVAPRPCYQPWQQRYSDLAAGYHGKVALAGDIEDPVFRLAIMEIALKVKFAIPELRTQLLATTGELIEDSKDSFWGWGADHKGWNCLGRLLVQIREEMREI